MSILYNIFFWFYLFLMISLMVSFIWILYDISLVIKVWNGEDHSKIINSFFIWGIVFYTSIISFGIFHTAFEILHRKKVLKKLKNIDLKSLYSNTLEALNVKNITISNITINTQKTYEAKINYITKEKISNHFESIFNMSSDKVNYINLKNIDTNSNYTFTYSQVQQLINGTGLNKFATATKENLFNTNIRKTSSILFFKKNKFKNVELHITKNSKWNKNIVESESIEFNKNFDITKGEEDFFKLLNHTKIDQLNALFTDKFESIKIENGICSIMLTQDTQKLSLLIPTIFVTSNSIFRRKRKYKKKDVIKKDVYPEKILFDASIIRDLIDIAKIFD